MAEKLSDFPRFQHQLLRSIAWDQCLCQCKRNLSHDMNQSETQPKLPVGSYYSFQTATIASENALSSENGPMGLNYGTASSGIRADGLLLRDIPYSAVKLLSMRLDPEAMSPVHKGWRDVAGAFGFRPREIKNMESTKSAGLLDLLSARYPWTTLDQLYDVLGELGRNDLLQEIPREIERYNRLLPTYVTKLSICDDTTRSFTSCPAFTSFTRQHSPRNHPYSFYFKPSPLPIQSLSLRPIQCPTISSSKSPGNAYLLFNCCDAQFVDELITNMTKSGINPYIAPAYEELSAKKRHAELEVVKRCKVMIAVASNDLLSVKDTQEFINKIGHSNIAKVVLVLYNSCRFLSDAAPNVIDRSRYDKDSTFWKAIVEHCSPQTYFKR